jgi:hypothetical protein
MSSGSSTQPSIFQTPDVADEKIRLSPGGISLVSPPAIWCPVARNQ